MYIGCYRKLKRKHKILIDNFKAGILIVIALSVMGCSSKPKYSEKENAILAQDIIRIEFRNPADQDCPKTFKKDIITERGSIDQFVAIMNNSKLDGPWKGACFSQINLITEDSIIGMSTNGEVFGHGSSGIFYRFPKTELIEIYIIE